MQGNHLQLSAVRPNSCWWISAGTDNPAHRWRQVRRHLINLARGPAQSWDALLTQCRWCEREGWWSPPAGHPKCVRRSITGPSFQMQLPVDLSVHCAIQTLYITYFYKYLLWINNNTLQHCKITLFIFVQTMFIQVFSNSYLFIILFILVLLFIIKLNCPLVAVSQKYPCLSDKQRKSELNLNTCALSPNQMSAVRSPSPCYMHRKTNFFSLVVGSQWAPDLDIQTAPLSWSVRCPRPSAPQTNTPIRERETHC